MKKPVSGRISIGASYNGVKIHSQPALSEKILLQGCGSPSALIPPSIPLSVIKICIGWRIISR